MALQEIGENGQTHDVPEISHRTDFDRIWLSITPQDRIAIETEIGRRLDDLIRNPNPNWGSITNTSIEGGTSNPITGIAGDWSGTAFHAIYEACGRSEGVRACSTVVSGKKSLSNVMNCGLVFVPTQRSLRGESPCTGKTYFLGH